VSLDPGQHGVAALIAPVDASAGAGSVVHQSVQAITRAIGRSGAGPGERLPSERELAGLLDVSRTTLRLALGELERHGVVSRRPGRAGGTFVGEPKFDRNLSLYGGMPEMLANHGAVAGTRVLSAALAAAEPRVADALGLIPGAAIYEIVRVRLSDGEPISLECSRFPADRFPGLLEAPLHESLYRYLHERFAAGPARAVERLEAVLATAEEARLLNVYPGAPLLAVDRVAFDAEGRAIEAALDLFRGDRTRAVVWSDGDREDHAALPEAGRRTPELPKASRRTPEMHR
jgi:GntR family transcriptional regulator